MRLSQPHDSFTVKCPVNNQVDATHHQLRGVAVRRAAFCSTRAAYPTVQRWAAQGFRCFRCPRYYSYWRLASGRIRPECPVPVVFHKTFFSHSFCIFFSSYNLLLPQHDRQVGVPKPCPNPVRVNAPMGLASLGLGTPRYARGGSLRSL